MKKESVVNGILSVSVLSAVILASLFFVDGKKWVGISFIVLGILHLLVLRFLGRSLQSVRPDLVFGMIDNGLLVIGALIGADLAGVIGAVVGGSAANAMTDGFAGIFEGWTAEFLRKRKIKEQRTAVSAAIGKMAGCLFGAGIVLVVVWTLPLL